MSSCCRYWQTVDDLLGLLGVFGIGFALPVASYAVIRASLSGEVPDVAIVLAVVGLAGGGVLALWVANLAEQAIHSRRRGKAREHAYLAVELAASLPRIPFLVRPFLCLWWLAHFLLGILVGAGVHHWVEIAFDRPLAVLSMLLPVVLHFAFMFAVNVYLLLAVAVWIPRQEVLSRLWSMRLVVDLSLTAVVLAFVLDLS